MRWWWKENQRLEGEQKIRLNKLECIHKCRFPKSWLCLQNSKCTEKNALGHVSWLWLYFRFRTHLKQNWKPQKTLIFHSKQPICICIYYDIFNKSLHFSPCFLVLSAVLSRGDLAAFSTWHVAVLLEKWRYVLQGLLFKDNSSVSTWEWLVSWRLVCNNVAWVQC